MKNLESLYQSISNPTFHDLPIEERMTDYRQVAKRLIELDSEQIDKEVTKNHVNEWLQYFNDILESDLGFDQHELQAIIHSIQVHYFPEECRSADQPPEILPSLIIDTTLTTEQQDRVSYIQSFQKILKTPLQILESKSQDVLSRLQQIEKTHLTLISKQERRDIREDLERFIGTINATQTELSQLTGDTNAQVRNKASQLTSNLQGACEALIKSYEEKQRVARRAAAVEAMTRPLITPVNLILKLFNLSPYQSISTRQSLTESVDEMLKIQHGFAGWVTELTDYEKQLRAEQTRQQIGILQQFDIQSTSNPATKQLIETHRLFSDELSRRYQTIKGLPDEARIKQFALLQDVERQLNRCVETFKNTNDEVRYQSALMISEILLKDNSNALKAYASPMLYALDTLTESSSFPTKIKEEEQLRASVQKALDNTMILLTHGKKMTHDHHYLVTEIEAFQRAANLWQKQRAPFDPRHGYQIPTPQEKESSNQALMTAYEKLYQLLDNQHAMRIIQRNPVVHQAWNILAHTMNTFYWLIGSKKRFALITRNDALTAIKDSMMFLKSNSQSQPTPPAEPSFLGSNESPLSPDLMPLVARLNHEKNALRIKTEQEHISDYHIPDESKRDQAFQQAMQATKMQRMAIKTLEYSLKELTQAANLDNIDRFYALTGLAQCYVNHQAYLSHDMKTAITDLLSSRLKTLSPLNLDKDSSARLEKTLSELDTMNNTLKQKKNAFFVKNQERQEAKTLLEITKQLRDVAKQEMNVSDYYEHLKKTLTTLIDYRKDGTIKQHLQDVNTFKAYLNQARKPFVTEDVIKQTLSVLGTILYYNGPESTDNDWDNLKEALSSWLDNEKSQALTTLTETFKQQMKPPEGSNLNVKNIPSNT